MGALSDVKWGPSGEVIYSRTYSRTLPDGSKETWPQTVKRVVNGNLALVDERYQLPGEREDLERLMLDFKLLPAGRHLWASGVKNAQHLFNCWVAGWTEMPSSHFEFAFMRLMEGGGVGANYSNHYLADYSPVQQELYVHIVCDPEHPDYDRMKAAGVLSTEFDPDWMGAFVIEDSREGWAAALVDLIDTHYREDVSHYQRVYDVSRVRAAGTKLKTFGGRASGPEPLARMLIDVCEIFSESHWVSDRLTGIEAMGVDHAIAQCVVAGGVRRSARMSLMHWEDPQVFEFINCKKDSGSHWTTNISVAVDKEFWKYNSGLLTDEGYGSLNSQVQAQRVLSELSQGAVRNGEPGMWDWSLNNVDEPNAVNACNPCSEIALEAWEPCNLGHINLAAFVNERGNLTPDVYYAHTLMTRFLIRATFAPVADPKSREVLDRNRRIGVGHLGVASALAMMGQRYSEAPLDPDFRFLLRALKQTVDDAAVEYAHQLRIPVPVKRTTVAPTGTIAKMPGVSEGIHPIFAKHFIRRIRFNRNSDFDSLSDLILQGYDVEDDLYAPNTAVVSIPTKDSLVEAVEAIWGCSDVVEAADDLTLNELLGFQALYQTCWADNAVSFTANVDPDRYTAADVEEQLRTFAGLIKGSTCFPESSFPQAPYTRITEEEYEAASAKAVSDGVSEECQGNSCPIR